MEVLALTAGQSIIATLAGFVCVVSVVIGVIDTYHQVRVERQVKRDKLRLSALAAQHRSDFDKDHPDRKRIGLKGDE